MTERGAGVGTGVAAVTGLERAKNENSENNDTNKAKIFFIDPQCTVIHQICMNNITMQNLYNMSCNGLICAREHYAC